MKQKFSNIENEHVHMNVLQLRIMDHNQHTCTVYSIQCSNSWCHKL